MASPLFELANVLAALQVGRRPEWSEQVDESDEPEYDGAPSRSDAGVDLQDAVTAMVCVRMRREAHRRTAYITLTHDAATTYTITINGTAHTPTPGADLAALVADLVADVNAGAEAAEVTASSESAGIVTIVGDIETDFSLEVAVAGGTGTISATADPLTATARIWVVGRGPNAPGRTGASTGDPGSWEAPPDTEYALIYRGMFERFPVAGMERLYVELDDVAGHADDVGVTYTPRVWIGPCLQETDE